jgi:hypothetical protein
MIQPDIDPPAGASCAEVALWRAVIALAVADRDAEWFKDGPDFRAVCWRADIDPAYLLRKAPEILAQPRRAQRPVMATA